MLRAARPANRFAGRSHIAKLLPIPLIYSIRRFPQWD